MKPGYKTTEFWVTGLVIAGVVLTAVSSVNVLPTKYGAIAVGLAAASYAISRGIAKIHQP